jgi:hypothetical protein
VSDERPAASPDAPALRIVNADATPQEVAALVAVLSALGSQPPAPPRRTVSEWAAPHRTARLRYSQGPSGWRASGLPR